jgi:hypothetical protein
VRASAFARCRPVGVSRTVRRVLTYELKIFVFVRAAVATFVIAGIAVWSISDVGDASRAVPIAIAELHDSGHDRVGTVIFRTTPGGRAMTVSVRAAGLEPGWHRLGVFHGSTCGSVDDSDVAIQNEEMPPLLVLNNGSALLKFKTDRLLFEDVADDPAGSVVVVAGTAGSGVESGDRSSFIEEMLGDDDDVCGMVEPISK